MIRTIADIINDLLSALDYDGKDYKGLEKLKITVEVHNKNYTEALTVDYKDLEAITKLDRIIDSGTFGDMEWDSFIREIKGGNWDIDETFIEGYRNGKPYSKRMEFVHSIEVANNPQIDSSIWTVIMTCEGEVNTMR